MHKTITLIIACLIMTGAFFADVCAAETAKEEGGPKETQQ